MAPSSGANERSVVTLTRMPSASPTSPPIKIATPVLLKPLQPYRRLLPSEHQRQPRLQRAHEGLRLASESPPPSRCSRLGPPSSVGAACERAERALDRLALGCVARKLRGAGHLRDELARPSSRLASCPRDRGLWRCRRPSRSRTKFRCSLGRAARTPSTGSSAPGRSSCTCRFLQKRRFRWGRVRP